MQFSSQGYIIKLRSYGEKSLIVTLVCPDKGKIVGYVSGAKTKRGLGVYQLGNKISFNAYARIEENMLQLKGVELAKSHAVDFMLDAAKTEALSSLCTLLDTCVAENDDMGKLFKVTEDFFEHINAENWLVYYSFFEFYLLDFLGVGLDISSCAVTGKTFDLQYISPKTGRAVCADVGAPYKDKLFSYPHYIADKNYLPNGAEIANLLEMTGSFLNKNFLQIHNLHLPEKRASLLEVNKLYHKI